MTTIKSLAFAIWLALTSWVPVHDQTAAYREPEAAAAGRYFDVAESIARVALDPDEPPLPLSDDDEEARARTGLLAASVLSYESAVANIVITCRKLGPGNARGPYQCEGKACADACIDVLHATRIALGMLRQSFNACRKLAMPDRLGHYTDGRCIGNWPRSRVRYGRAERWWKAHSLAAVDGLREGFEDWD